MPDENLGKAAYETFREESPKYVRAIINTTEWSHLPDNIKKLWCITARAAVQEAFNSMVEFDSTMTPTDIRLLRELAKYEQHTGD